MKEHTGKLLDRAQDAIEAADILLTNDSFDKRLIGDYGVEANLQMDVVASMIHQAQEFLEAAKRYLGEG